MKRVTNNIDCPVTPNGRASVAARRTLARVAAVLILLVSGRGLFAQSASTGITDAPSPTVLAAGLYHPTPWTKTLVIVQLQGGNDGLNMIVPYTDPLYYRLRPTLAVPHDRVLPLGKGLGLNPTMKPLMGVWKAGQMAVVLGVGYPHPNRSHFRGTDIWETGSGSGQVLHTGWLERVVNRAHPPASLIADATILGGLGQGPVAGPDVKTISMNDPAQFIVAARELRSIDSSPASAARRTGAHPAVDTGGVPARAAYLAGGTDASPSPLQILRTVQVNLTEAADRMAALKAREPHLSTVFPKTRFGREMHNAAELIAMGADIPIIKVQIGGFDTHWNELARQNAVLGDLAESLSAFRSAMVESGKWNSVLVMTYSEFGRRVMENGSGGTDHGTAEPLLILGGSVTGGFYGAQPSLSHLDAGDLRFTTDYRSVYLSVAESWFGLAPPATAGLFPGVAPAKLGLIPFLRTVR